MVRKVDKLSLKKCRSAPKDLQYMAKIPELSVLSALFAFSEHPPVCPVDVVHMAHIETVEVERRDIQFES